MNLDEAYAEHDIEPPKAKRAAPEHSLQAHIKTMVREYVATGHLFAAHDRTQKHSATQHIREKARGMVAGWPDIEIPLMGGVTFRCELKAAGIRVVVGSEQDRLIRELNSLGHPTAWANSAVMFVREARRFGVPFRVGVDRKAQSIDDMLAEWKRQRDLGKPQKKGGSRPRKEQPLQRALDVIARARAAGIFT